MDAFHNQLQTWLREVLLTEKPVEEIAAFRFGLGEVEEGYVLYLAGSVSYDEADDEWAAYPPEFVAENELIISEEESEWHWVLLKTIYSLGRILRQNPAESSFLGDSMPVYTGFESGDLYRIK